MSRMITRTLSAVLAFMIPAVAAAQTTGEVAEVDRVVYQVESKYPVAAYPDGYVMDDHYSWEGSAPYDPRYQYSAKEQQAIIDEELRITGGRLSMDTDGSSVIEITQPEIPEATRNTAPPPQDIYEEDGAPPAPQFQGGSMSPTLAPATYTRRYLHTNGFGNNIFGANYSIDTFIQATDASGTAAKKVSAYVEGKVQGVAFNHTKEVIRARIDVAGQQGGTNSGTAKLYTLGQLIYTKNLAATFSLTPYNVTRTFGSVAKTFMVGPVPVTVTASLAGGVKLTVSGAISPTQAKLSVTPGAYVNVAASAAINIIIVSFGVSGSLMLINVGIPAIAELTWPLCSALTWKLSSTLSLNTLSGNLKLFVKVKVLWFIKKTYSVTIANWSGLTKNITLFSKSGSFAMGICPGFAPAQSPSLMSMAAEQ